MIPFPTPLLTAGGAAAVPFTPDSLFVGGEIGDTWLFDNVHTDQSTVTGSITTATGIVNSRVFSSAGAVHPTLNSVSGYYCCNFTASTVDYLVHALGATVAQPGTIILCLDTGGTPSRVMLTGSSTTSRWQISADSSSNLIAFGGSTLDTTLNVPVTKRILTVEFNGASSVVRSNGTQIATGNTGSQSTNQITLGALYDGTVGSALNVYGLIFINRILNSTERDNAERYLGAQAGVSW